jgi:hypothetical protein
MTTITEMITKKETRLAAYYAAETAILGGAQSYSIGNRSLTRADLKNIQEMIRRLESEIIKLGRGNRITAHRVVPRDTV